MGYLGSGWNWDQGSVWEQDWGPGVGLESGLILQAVLNTGDLDWVPINAEIGLRL